MVSQLAAKHVKVVLGGQGGDEVFGGYARYLLAYFEQCIKAAIDGNYRNGHYVVTIELIVPNLGLLREYKPLMAQFWGEGLFGDLDARYFRLIDRSADMSEEVDWSLLDKSQVFEDFRTIFNNPSNVRKEAYFDKMTHFDFKCLLPALLHVEDRMSMAHGLESRVPLLDHPLIEFAATVPADVKFQDGQMKHLIRLAFEDVLPEQLMQRRDKMGFPVPLKEWFSGELSGFAPGCLPQRRGPHATVREFGQSFGECRQDGDILAQGLGTAKSRTLAPDVSRSGDGVERNGQWQALVPPLPSIRRTSRSGTSFAAPDWRRPSASPTTVQRA